MRYHLINHRGVEYILDTRRHKLVCSCAHLLASEDSYEVLLP